MANEAERLFVSLSESECKLITTFKSNYSVTFPAASLFVMDACVYWMAGVAGWLR